jgi:hypothetical protein
MDWSTHGLVDTWIGRHMDCWLIKVIGHQKFLVDKTYWSSKVIRLHKLLVDKSFWSTKVIGRQKLLVDKVTSSYMNWSAKVIVDKRY